LSELAQRPEYINPLQEEVEAILANGEATVASCDQMILLDSFLKECQRVHPPAAGISIFPAPRNVSEMIS
jgi:cytochrome P450